MEENYRENYRIAQKHFINYSIGDPTSVLAKEHGLIGINNASEYNHVARDLEFVKLYKTIRGYYYQGKLKKPCEYPQGQNKLK